MGGICIEPGGGGDDKCVHNFFGKSEWKRPLELSVGERIILKWILGK
jgi:hypothetical protein